MYTLFIISWVLANLWTICVGNTSNILLVPWAIMGIIENDVLPPAKERSKRESLVKNSALLPWEGTYQMQLGV